MTTNKVFKNLKNKRKKNPDYLAGGFVCLLFFFAYLTLSLVKHAHFGTGYDLSVDNQVVWEYSRFLPPISTVHAYAFTSVFSDHVEFIYLLLSPFYWLIADARMLIFLQAIAIALSGIPVYLLAKKYKINTYLSLSILGSYFMFYGVQNALWSDVHSLVFGAAFLSWFIYFLDLRQKWPAVLFFLLAITSKEDIALLTFLISFVYFIRDRQKLTVYLMVGSIVYLFAIFFIYYPHFAGGYRFANKNGLLSNINLLNFINTREKINVIFYSLTAFGYLPLLNPLALIPFLGDLAHYFILGNDSTTSAQTIFLHYRVTDALLLAWPAILVIGKYKKLNNKYLSLYVLGFAILTTYLLHSPLTYLSKSWFWTKPSGVNNINNAIDYLPKDTYVVTQTNISPHISNRKLIVTMWGERKDFISNSPCGKENCAWFKWAGKPEYMIVDTSPEWDARHLLANRPDFIEGLENMEKTGKLTLEKEFGSSKIYKINY